MEFFFLCVDHYLGRRHSQEYRYRAIISSRKGTKALLTVGQGTPLERLITDNDVVWIVSHTYATLINLFHGIGVWVLRIFGAVILRDNKR